MKRVSTEMNPNNFRTHISRQESKISQIQDNLATQTRFQNLRQDPISVAASVRYDSFLTRLNKFSDNAAMAQINLRTREEYMTESLNVLNRLKELAIKGANGTYSESDMRAMGIEANELLEELLFIANAKGVDGRSLFSGTRLNTEAFVATRSSVIDGYKEMINTVEYQGDIFDRKLEISDGQYTSDSLVGNKVFWAQNQRIETPNNVESYVATSDSSFTIDGAIISLQSGDGIYDIIDKINNANIAVHSSLDPVSKGLVFETTIPHQIWFDENTENSRVLRDLGIMSDLDTFTPFNYHQSLKIQGGSMFDVIISLRDSLLEGNHNSLGSSDLQGIAIAIDNLLTNIADLGARDAKLSQMIERLGNQILLTTEQYTNNIGLDISQAIADFGMLKTARETTLGTQARISQTSLLNFLK